MGRCRENDNAWIMHREMACERRKRWHSRTDTYTFPECIISSLTSWPPSHVWTTKPQSKRLNVSISILAFQMYVLLVHGHTVSFSFPLCPQLLWVCIKAWGCEGKACWQDWGLNPTSAMCSPGPGDAGKQLAEVSFNAEGTSQRGTCALTQPKAHLLRQPDKTVTEKDQKSRTIVSIDLLTCRG